MVKAPDKLRFVVPLYRVAEAACIVDVPASTLATWAQGYVRRSEGHADVAGEPIITYVAPDGPGRPSIPFVGLTEALVLAAMRRSGVPMQRIRPALQILEQDLKVDHALASHKLYTDGAETSTTPPVAAIPKKAKQPSTWSSSAVARRSSPTQSRE